MTDFYDWSQTAASNATADTDINWQENQAPDTVNDSARNMMRRIAQWRSDLAPVRTTTGSGNAYSVASYAGGTGSYRDGEIVAFVVDRTNTAACTLNSNSRGAVPFRPALGVEFKAGELVINTVAFAYYRSASNEFIASNTGYYVNQMTSGLLAQSVASRLMRIGQPIISLSPTVTPGCVRLTEATQTLNKSDWPELWTVVSGWGAPWGSASTTFNLPPAAGYFLRFAATSSSIDTSGARSAGSTQTDQNKSHTHTGTVDSSGAHVHTGAVGTQTTSGAQSAPSFNAVTGVGTTSTGSSGTHTHTFTTDSSGGDEVRVKNVAFHVDILASTALTASTIAVFGHPMAWDTGTSSADPGTARVRVNNATMGSATALYVSDTDAWGADLDGLLDNLATGHILKLSKVGAQANYIQVQATGSSTDHGTWHSLPVTVVGTSGSFSNNDNLALEFTGTPGAAGATGPAGGGIPWNWDTGTTAADPGSGKIRGNNATLASITEFYVNNSDANGTSETTWLDAFDDSTSSVKGYLQLTKSSATANSLLFRISSVAGSSYRTISVTYVSGAATFLSSDSISLSWARTGDAGAGGDFSSNTATSVDSEFVLFSGTDGKTGKRATGTGFAYGTSGVASFLAAMPAWNALSNRGSDIASGSTIDLDAATGRFVDVTGTTTITAITLTDGDDRWVRFTGALTLTHGASLVLPGAASITTAAGDWAHFVGFSAGVVRCASYLRASGRAVVGMDTSLDTTWTGQHTFALGTITTSKPLTISQTWNAGGVTFDAFLVDVTTTSSASGSRLANLRVGGTSVFYVRKDGVLGSDTAFSAGMMLNHASAMTVFGRAADVSTSNQVAIGDDGGGVPGVRVGNSIAFSFSSSAGGTGTADTLLKRAAAAVVSCEGASSAGATLRHIPRRPAQITADQNNYNPGGTSKYLHLNTDASRTLTGMTFTAAQVDGQEHVIVNVGSNNLVLANESASSTAANRFKNSTGADITLSASQAADLHYDGTQSRWLVFKRN